MSKVIGHNILLYILLIRLIVNKFFLVRLVLITHLLEQME